MITLLDSLVLQLHKYDIALLRKINLGRIHSLDAFLLFITGSAGLLAFGLPVLFLIAGFLQKKKLWMVQALYVFASVSISDLISWILKILIDRPRPFISFPDIEKLTSANSASFPSGHTVVAFAFAFSLSLICKNKFISILSIFWAVIVGWSRMHLGVHYPSDVACSVIIAAAAAGLFHALFNKHKSF